MIPERQATDDVRALSVRAAAKLTGLSRTTIAQAMDKWTHSRGRIGLKWFAPTSRRMVRLSELRAWFGAMERNSCYGY